ncbi:MAG TPA: aminopeptidase N, partial [Pseudomonas sp.]|nr:aminopeptidase N [Pseudomonas sp.]
MRTEQPKMIALSDYRLPDYLIDETHLTFELHESYALVHARLLMQRNPGLDESLPPLVLDGQQLELVDIELDGRQLTSVEYTLTDSHLQIQPTKNQFELSTTVRIEPQNNTALEGLYKSSGMFCTQCEAEGFRKITYYLDRPDVMSRFTTTIHAEKHRYPILLSNGNPIAEGEDENGRHWVTWEDPFKKP